MLFCCCSHVKIAYSTHADRQVRAMVGNVAKHDAVMLIGYGELNNVDM